MKKRTKGNGKRRVTVTAEEFVKAWAKGGTIADVASRCGMSTASATSRGARFRKAGVRLPDLERLSSRRIDVAALNALLK